MRSMGLIPLVGATRADAISRGMRALKRPRNDVIRLHSHPIDVLFS